MKPSACCAQRCAIIRATKRCVRCLMNLDGPWPSRLWLDRPFSPLAPRGEKRQYRRGAFKLTEQKWRHHEPRRAGQENQRTHRKGLGVRRLKQKILGDPAGTLKAEGLELPAGMS